jgi:hypothetical protein
VGGLAGVASPPWGDSYTGVARSVFMEMAHEVAVYIDRFHNLDLFQQG